MLKSYIFTAVLTLCCVFYWTSLTGGNINSHHSTGYCSLCLTESPRIRRVGNCSLCPECFTPYNNWIRAEINEQTSLGHLCVLPPRDETVFSFQQSLPLSDIRHVRFINKCLTSVGMRNLTELFVTYRKPCNPESLMEFINETKKIRFCQEWASLTQTYMAGLQLITIRRKLELEERRLQGSIPNEVIINKLYDMMYGTLLTRIRLLTYELNVVNLAELELEQIDLESIENDTNDDRYETALKNILNYSVLGWPAFLTEEEAEVYRALMPPTHNVLPIMRRATGTIACYIVAEY